MMLLRSIDNSIRHINYVPETGGGMQKTFIGVLISLAMHLFFNLALGAQTQFYGENWFRYTQKIKDDTTQQSEFEAKRIYFRYKHWHTGKLESRITLELYSDDDYPDGAGLKLKDAYVKFKGIIPEGDITVGLQKQYFGRVYDWEYWVIEKAIEEKYKVIHGSRDYGISVGGYLPKGYGTWRLEVINGEGYKKVGDNINTELGYIGDLRLIPIPGLTIGGSFITENTGSRPYKKRLYYTGLLRYVKGPIDVWAQYLGGKKGDADDPTSQMGYMVFPKFSLRSPVGIDLEFFGRFDYWDPDTDKNDDGKYMYLGGLNYFFSRQAKGKPGVMLQIAFVREQPELRGTAPIDKVMLQLRWHWATPKLG